MAFLSLSGAGLIQRKNGLLYAKHEAHKVCVFITGQALSLEFMDIFQSILVLAAFLSSLVAGFLFAYEIVVMPGIKNLDDREFIRAFQVTDRIIQNNQPVFMLVWVGSAIAVLVSAFLGFDKLLGLDFYLLALASLTYIVAVQLLTIVVHLPLNNRLQALNVNAMSETDLKVARSEFEPRWNASNTVRTAASVCVSAMLIILLFRL